MEGNISGLRLSDIDLASDGGMNFFMNSPIGVYILQNGRFVCSNARFQEMTGYSEAELARMDSMTLVVPEDRDHVKTSALLMLKDKRQEPYRFRVVDKAGDVRWIIETVASVRYQGERAVLGNFMDVTEQKRIESNLEESEKKYRSLFEMAHEGIVIVRYEDGLILDANAEFLKQTGYPPDVVRTKKFWELQPVQFQEEAKKTFFRFRETSGGIISWKLCERSEGKVLPVEITARNMVMEGQEVILCMVRDISEREAMMRALTQASEEWRKSFDALDDAVLVIGPDFIIHRANLAAARMTGMDVRAVIGKKCHRLFHGTDAPPEYCPHHKARTAGVYCEAEQEEPHLGRILHFSASPIRDDAGEMSLIVEIISDVTDRRRYERDSIQLGMKLAESFKGITESLSELAESRDPYTAGHSRHVAELTALVGREMEMNAESLQGLYTCAMLHDIGKSIIPAAILNKPGQLTKHEWGMIRAHPTTAYETLRHIPFPWPAADVVHQHHERLDGSGYPLGLKGNQIHPWARIIAVADVVDAVTSHRPYRPGFPRQNAIDELKRGKGTLYDPRAVDLLIRVLYLSDKRALVVDEDARTLASLVEALKLEGLEAVGFSEPALALKEFAQKPFPLVITELSMLSMDGAALTQRIKEINPNTEVIAFSRYGGKEETLRLLRAGVSDFLEKPIDLEILKKSINRALQRFMGKIR